MHDHHLAGGTGGCDVVVCSAAQGPVGRGGSRGFTTIRGVDRSARQHIEINGTVYRSLDEVPEQYRASVAALFTDRDGDGVPDIMQGAEVAGSFTTTTRHETYEVGGVTYDSLDDVPEPARSMLRDAVRKPASPPEPRPSDAAPAMTTSANTVISESGMSHRTRLLLGFLVVDAAVVALVVWLVVR